MADYCSSVAIVGIGGIFPDAPDLAAYWDNIRSCRSAFREVPDGRWMVPADSVFDPEPGKADCVYSRRGCFIDRLPSAATLPDLSIDPALLDGLDPLFHLLIHAGKRAFDDGVTAPLDRSRVGIIIGNLALPTETSALLTRNGLGRTFEEQLLGSASPSSPISPLNRFPTGLPAGILARTLGLGGGACTLDAACASSLYALKLAIDELLSGRVDAMLSGGVSRPDPLFTQMGFSQLRALSKRGICSPFDAAGDGLVVGEGAGLFLLKRTEDAVAHGDRIYGVIRGVGLANDVGGSLLAPLSEGQLRAMRAAYHQAGWQPDDVDLIECHATGTPVGDAVEVASLKQLWTNGGRKDAHCVIGSVKSNIGHLLTAAGGAAVTKVLLALQNETLPPTANFNTAQSGMNLDESPFRILTSPVPWQRRGAGIPRRAAVSAFGFGGINAHLLIEEWLPASPPPDLPPLGGGVSSLTQRGRVGEREAIAVVGMDARFGPWKSLRAFQERVLGGDDTVLPTPPKGWRGAAESRWFRAEGLDATPFAGFTMDEVALPANRFRIPPREMEEMLPQQLLMLQTAAEALLNAGCDRDSNSSTGVFIGIALDLNSTNFSLRWDLTGKLLRWEQHLGRELTTKEQSEWLLKLRAATGPSLNANRTMGALGSVVASRIAREFRIGGPSFTISSEESSGIRALEVAVRQLQNRELDRALVGAVDLAGDLRAVLGQHALHPYSHSGSSAPFDETADGALIGEGACAVVLKRLEDAERDGDRVYAVIRGIGSASGDPVAAGQKTYLHALDKAYADAGVPRESVGLIEASADGTPEADAHEAAALASWFASDNAPARSCAVSSVKGDIGHSGAASGLASFVRGCLALYHEIIPGCRSLTSDAPALPQRSPLHFPRSSRYWLRNRSDGPRRAGVTVQSVDGSCSHVVLEGYDTVMSGDTADRCAPLGAGSEALFAIAGDTTAELLAQLDLLEGALEGSSASLYDLASTWYPHFAAGAGKKRAMAIVARDRAELTLLIDLGRTTLKNNGTPPATAPGLRDRLFYSAKPLGSAGKVAFVFPGSGNHYSGMGMELFSRWPDVLRRQDQENLLLRAQFQPELFWNGAAASRINDDHRSVIFGQVATGCAVSDLVQRFGVHPAAVIGYSLGESAGLFSQRAWRDRDAMYDRMQESTLFSDDLAGECRAAKLAWGLKDGETVQWSLGVVAAPERAVQALLPKFPRTYLLIVNTPDECVIGGDASKLSRLVAALDSPFFPLQGVTTVHCEVAQQVATPYHDLHLYPTKAPTGVVYYSGVSGDSYEVTRESAAASILGQALHGLNYPQVIESAYRDGVRLFLEMGPGASCSRMIGRILGDRPHLARSACHAGQDPVSVVLKMLANLIAERLPVDLSPLFDLPHRIDAEAHSGAMVRVVLGGAPFQPPQPDVPCRGDAVGAPIAAIANDAVLPDRATRRDRPYGNDNSLIFTPDSLISELARSQQSHSEAHAAFLTVSETVTAAMAQALTLEMSLRQALGDDAPFETNRSRPDLIRGGDIPLSPPDKGGWGVAFNRELCFEFARGSVARMLGPDFTEVDAFPTRVRLPDEPLMLVDRIMSVEGEPRSMSHGRVVTEHDIQPGAWYLDGGRIPTCIAVEAGQADLFLSGYLGIDFMTRGLAVYRLLDAVVTFHRGLPGPGETIHYDIRIERFFRQGHTWLFRFFFEATINGQPLLSMRDGCAGFFSQQELDAGKGIVRPVLDLRPTSGIRPADWQDLVPLAREGYDAAQLDRLRNGDLAGCFGPLFARLPLSRPLTIPGGRMRLVHRVNEIDPNGGRCGIGLIRAEADIHPDDWFITCHFVDDRVMPGTLMYECCMHTLRIYLLRIGWVAEAAGSVWEPLPGVASKLCCRGQVLESTRVVTYEVTIREIGYRPEPYVICDALMYADGKPIVEITSMSARLTGTTREQLQALWSGQHTSADSPLPLGGGGLGRGETCQNQSQSHLHPSPTPLPSRVGEIKPSIYTKEQILAYSNGNPSEGFGDRYRIFDSGRKIARLPGPPFQFMDRVTALRGEPWQMTAGAMAEAQYDLPADAWFFAAERQPRMPFCVLLEAALQPCGWLAAYVGSALTSPNDISFRNLGGTAVQHRTVTPDSGVLTCCATMNKVATSGGMIIQEFDFSVADRHGILYEGDTMFGFFAKEALANQVGLRDAKPYQPTESESRRGRSLLYPDGAPFPEKQLAMIDRIELYVPDGGPNGLGYIRGIKDVDPDEWFFKAHFYEDPVTPGSLGLESFIQLMKFAAVERWEWKNGTVVAAVALERKHHWLYRGQVVPTNSRVTVSAWITAVDDQKRIMTADGFLSVDGKLIYQMMDFTVTMEPL
ncbi:MAG TPA: type I polyketide synthase [Desulfuromonadales bacterium]|nr:type I polyketide synthase [Desulfuromonadales bacterium]